MDSIRSLPSVDQVLRELPDLKAPRKVVVSLIRAILDERRNELLKGETLEKKSIAELTLERIAALDSPSLRPVINATGVVLHTNLGRAPLPRMEPAQRYSNLEYDLATGRRGKRDTHTAGLLQQLLQREAITVNNNAAAVFLVLHELAAGCEVIVSRGELIEIGDGFRIPEIMERAGVVLREVGTTNRTHLHDYRAAINPNTRLILRVHPSNFRVSGFTAKPELKDLCALGQQTGVPVYEDLGSGCLVNLSGQGINEPLVTDSLDAGANVVTFSCDKLLGGPQTGLITGDETLVARIRRSPMYRALRVDKLVIAALETTLRHLLFERWDEIPALRMIRASDNDLKRRAERVAAQLGSLPVQISAGRSPIGGGSTPDQMLATWRVEITPAHAVRFERALRRASPPVVARIAHGRISLDMRTVSDDEVEDLLRAVRQAAQEG